MTIRSYQPSDLETLKRIHAASGLPPNCFPPIDNPNMIVKLVGELGGRVVQFGGVKLVGEAFVLADHEQGTPQERWELMQRVISSGLRHAARLGVEEISAWLPPEIEASFGPRLESLGWQKSPWPTYTALLK